VRPRPAVAGHVAQPDEDAAVRQLTDVVEVAAQQVPVPRPVSGGHLERGVVRLRQREQTALQPGILRGP